VAQADGSSFAALEQIAPLICSAFHAGAVEALKTAAIARIMDLLKEAVAAEALSVAHCASRDPPRARDGRERGTKTLVLV
jgi:hypothetical protein